MITRQNFLYRSGNLDSITDLGKQKLNELRVFIIFDLRGENESASYEQLNSRIGATSTSVNSIKQCQSITGIERVVVPMRDQDSPARMLEKFWDSRVVTPEVRYANLYSGML